MTNPRFRVALPRFGDYLERCRCFAVGKARVSHPSPPHPHSWGRRAPSPALLPTPSSEEHRRYFSRAFPELVRFLFDPRVAPGAKLLVFVAAVYLVFPFDVVPDLAPVVGWLDDIGVTAVAFLFLNRAWKQYREKNMLMGSAVGTSTAGAARSRSTVVDTTGSDVSRD